MGSNTKHIVFLTPGFAANESDTKCVTYFLNFLEEFKNLNPNIKLSVIAFQYPFFETAYQWKGIDIYPMNGGNKGFPNSIVVWYQVLKKIEQIRTRNTISCIHSLWLKECALLGSLIQKKLQIPHICTLMGTEIEKRNNNYWHFISKKNIQLISVSEKAQDIFKQNFSLDTKVIPWGINKRKEIIAHERPIDILGVGFINSNKNYELFLRVIADLVKNNKDLSVFIVGDGEQKLKIKANILEMKLEHHITLKGIVPNHEVEQLMSQSKILLHTSNFETQGYVFLEALKYGMQIVSKKVGIAKTQEKWWIANSKDECVEGCQFFLRQKNVERYSTILYPVKDTVQSYLDLYQEKL